MRHLRELESQVAAAQVRFSHESQRNPGKLPMTALSVEQHQPPPPPSAVDKPQPETRQAAPNPQTNWQPHRAQCEVWGEDPSKQEAQFVDACLARPVSQADVQQRPAALFYGSVTELRRRLTRVRSELQGRRAHVFYLTSGDRPVHHTLEVWNLSNRAAGEQQQHQRYPLQQGFLTVTADDAPQLRSKDAGSLLAIYDAHAGQWLPLGVLCFFGVSTGKDRVEYNYAFAAPITGMMLFAARQMGLPAAARRAVRLLPLAGHSAPAGRQPRHTRQRPAHRRQPPRAAVPAGPQRPAG